MENKPQYINWIAEKLPKKNLSPSLRNLVSKALTEAIRLTTDEEMKERYFLERMKISVPDDNNPEQFDIYKSLVDLKDIKKFLKNKKFRGNEEDLLDFLNTLSVIHNSRGNGTEAFKIIKYAVSINEKHAQENFEAYGANLAHSLIILSFLCQQNGEVGKSSESLSRAVEIHQKTPMSNFYVVLALMLASWYENKNIFNILNENSEGMQLNFDSIYSIMEFACRSGFEELVDFILRHGGNVNMMNPEGFTPLMWASMEGNLTIAKMLLDAGANINALNNDGRTALMLASKKGNESVVDLLIKFGADYIFSDLENATALELACFHGHEDVAKLLILAGSEITEFDAGRLDGLMYRKVQGEEVSVQNFLSNYFENQPYFPDFFYPLFSGDWKVSSVKEAEKICHVIIHSKYNHFLLKNDLYSIRSISPSFCPDGKIFEFLFCSKPQFSNCEINIDEQEEEATNFQKFSSVIVLLINEDIYLPSNMQTVTSLVKNNLIVINQDTALDYLQFVVTFSDFFAGVFRIFPGLEYLPSAMIKRDDGSKELQLKPKVSLSADKQSILIKNCVLLFRGEMGWADFSVSFNGYPGAASPNDEKQTINITFDTHILERSEKFKRGIRYFRLIDSPHLK